MPPDTTPNQPRLRWPLVIIVALALTLLIVAPMARRARQAGPTTPALPMLSRVTPFSLTDSTSHTFGLAQLKNKIWVATFFFTTCPTLCPIMMNSMARLYDTYEGNPDVHFVGVSVNPQYDSPTILADYGESYGADPAQWHFLTGSLKAIEHLSVKGLKVGTKDDPINHSAYLVLVDRSGRIRGYYDGQDDAAVDRLREAIAQLLDGKGG
jgi:protein SCO1/2